MFCLLQSELKRERLSGLSHCILASGKQKQSRRNWKAATHDKRKDCMYDLCICLIDYLDHIIRSPLSTRNERDSAIGHNAVRIHR